MKRFLINKLKSTLLILILGLGIGTFQATAASVSPQMIEQFKQLPTSEQSRLAQQYGIDPSMLGGGSGSSQEIQQPQQPVVQPRSSAQPASFSPSASVISAKEEQSLKPFGYDLIAGQPITFAPVSDIPVPADYRIGPGDSINVQLYGKESKRFTLVVDRLGNVQIPDMEPVTVIDMTYGELKAAIQSFVSRSVQ
ncbi:polysaccharide biosynthesis/export family protein [Nitrincola sp.]|uniref:polysaccharide biosynthesis/export family protein n=1 Tax=Nitrincola sp. TaxID=1926584 RepID=UPI003A8D7F38